MTLPSQPLTLGNIGLPSSLPTQGYTLPPSLPTQGYTLPSTKQSKSKTRTKAEKDEIYRQNKIKESKYRSSPVFKELQRFRTDASREPLEFSEAMFGYMQSQTRSLKYHRRRFDIKTAVHWGQLKLLLSEIYAFVRFWNPDEVPDLTVVYVGAAPGLHFLILTQLFPMIKEWHLYDGKESGIPGLERIDEVRRVLKSDGSRGDIYTYTQYFTDDTAREWEDRGKNVFFFSDIRRLGPGSAKDERELEESIKGDMNMQMRWVEIIRPYQAHLKFRLPYGKPGAPLKTRYLSGYVIFQPFAPLSSTETRLVPIKNQDGSYSYQDYGTYEYEEKNFFRNAITREAVQFYDPITHQLNNIAKLDGEGLDNRCDSVFALFIMNKYIEFMGDTRTEKGSPARLMMVISLMKGLRSSISSLMKRKTTIITLRNDFDRRREEYMRGENVTVGDEDDEEEEI